MGFLNKRDGEQDPEQAPQQAALSQEPADGPSAAAYQAGSLADVPEAGRARMERMKKAAQAGFFTSDLSVNEFLLVSQAGFEPLGLVLGSSIYHIGFQQSIGTRARRWACSRRRCTTRASSR